jgi:hypothetical protein
MNEAMNLLTSLTTTSEREEEGRKELSSKVGAGL